MPDGMLRILGHTSDEWAEAIASRISDEWGGAETGDPDSKVLEEVLAAALKAVPDQLQRLIGTQIIEEDYFD
jgi:hypothetical protein